MSGTGNDQDIEELKEQNQRLLQASLEMAARLAVAQEGLLTLAAMLAKGSHDPSKSFSAYAADLRSVLAAHPSLRESEGPAIAFQIETSLDAFLRSLASRIPGANYFPPHKSDA